MFYFVDFKTFAKKIAYFRCAKMLDGTVVDPIYFSIVSNSMNKISKTFKSHYWSKINRLRTHFSAITTTMNLLLFIFQYCKTDSVHMNNVNWIMVLLINRINKFCIKDDLNHSFRYFVCSIQTNLFLIPLVYLHLNSIWIIL